MNCSEILLLLGSRIENPELLQNCTNGTFEDYEENNYDVPVAIVALLFVFYGTISVVAVVGNFLVMWIVATSRRMQNVTNCFIANLAMADIVIGLFAIPFQDVIDSVK
ncbi:hypothetical protein GE061_012131 [Apolygus lucorum]|uniref:G-protein coupled receptors family 1 profile domain-containing protein n=1 Tax=Apolygus lucorum TaxID=248454 RepID=A0A8S9XTP5_APOLU|nr:hypothetical protein GE061_012131 [Apolygus lucorum]